MSGRIARIEIDEAKCIGSDACVAVAPKTFKIDPETNVAKVIDVNGDPFNYQMTAGADCPPEAIKFFDFEGKEIEINLDEIDFPKDKAK
jgi:ferredoxin